MFFMDTVEVKERMWTS